jgi:hypothetical protein
MADVKLCECGCGYPTSISKYTWKERGYVKGEPRRFLRGHGLGNMRHGMSCGPKRSAEVEAYYGAKQRCNNPHDAKYEDYGGRGIQFLFTSFEDFYTELGPRPDGMSLDRIDNSGPYAPGNVRWATAKQQANNRRLPRVVERADNNV